MKTITKGLSLAVLALAAGGIAHAAQDTRGWGGPDANATVTRAEAQAKAEAMFAEHDANKDGKLDSADMAAKMGQKFDAMDTDRNGALSRDEFMAAHQTMHGKQGHEGHKMGMGEGREGRRGGHDRKGGMMRMADTNGDGAVSKQEAVAGALKHFDMADANKDGKLTPEERKAAHAKMRDHMKGMRGGMDHGAMPPPPPPAG
jgi:Ca2+-binding EF-hand superfamily protein